MNEAMITDTRSMLSSIEENENKVNLFITFMRDCISKHHTKGEQVEVMFNECDYIFRYIGASIFLQCLYDELCDSSSYNPNDVYLLFNKYPYADGSVILTFNHLYDLYGDVIQHVTEDGRKEIDKIIHTIYADDTTEMRTDWLEHVKDCITFEESWFGGDLKLWIDDKKMKEYILNFSTTSDYQIIFPKAIVYNNMLGTVKHIGKLTEDNLSDIISGYSKYGSLLIREWDGSFDSSEGNQIFLEIREIGDIIKFMDYVRDTAYVTIYKFDGVDTRELQVFSPRQSNILEPNEFRCMFFGMFCDIEAYMSKDYMQEVLKAIEDK